MISAFIIYIYINVTFLYKLNCARTRTSAFSGDDPLYRPIYFTIETYILYISPASRLAIVATLEQVAGNHAIRFTLAQMGGYTLDDSIAWP